MLQFTRTIVYAPYRIQKMLNKCREFEDRMEVQRAKSNTIIQASGIIRAMFFFSSYPDPGIKHLIKKHIHILWNLWNPNPSQNPIQGIATIACCSSPEPWSTMSPAIRRCSTALPQVAMALQDRWKFDSNKPRSERKGEKEQETHNKRLTSMPASGMRF